MKFAVVTNKNCDPEFSVTKKVTEILSSGHTCVSVDRNLLENVIDSSDVVVTIGGDGTILGIAQVAAKHEIPVLGINKGKLGYLAELEPDEVADLTKIFSKDFLIEKRMMLKAKITKEGFPTETFFALNDFVVSHGSVLKLINISLFCDNLPVASYRADGIILATPTGSTAFSLSAGGPIVDPSNRIIIVTPICPHTLSSRPILFTESSVLSIECFSESESPRFYFDGGEGIPLEQGVKIEISVSPYSLKLIRIKNNSFINILTKKLH